MAGSSKPAPTSGSGPDAENGRQPGADDGDHLDRRRKALAEKLDQAAAETAPAPQRAQGDMSGIGAGLKIGSEFVAGVLVGAGMGYLIDQFAGTTPWGLIVFLMLGFAAGVLNVMRATGRVAEPRPHGLRDRAKAQEDDKPTHR